MKYRYTPGLLEWLFVISVMAMGTQIAFADIADGTPEFTWQLPTVYDDGAPVDPNDLQDVNLYCTPEGGIEQVFTRPVIPQSWTAPEETFPRGVLHTCEATLVDVTGEESARSSSIGFEIADFAPPAPTVLRVAEAVTRRPAFDWDAVTTRADGSPVTVARYLLFCTPSISTIEIDSTELSFSAGVGLFSPDDYSCTLVSEDDEGRQSEASNAVAFRVLPGSQVPSVIINVQ